jgi:hypothetical protein
VNCAKKGSNCDTERALEVTHKDDETARRVKVKIKSTKSATTTRNSIEKENSEGEKVAREAQENE